VRPGREDELNPTAILALTTPVFFGMMFGDVGAGALLGILVLDALVAAVQTIRLEFYEGLSRYFRGDGREFRPIGFAGTGGN
jgi:V/A-type H+-transporting ATPase subunit I